MRSEKGHIRADRTEGWLAVDFIRHYEFGSDSKISPRAKRTLKASQELIQSRPEYSAKLSAMRASDIKPITYMKTHSAELVAAVNKKRSPVFITQNGTPRAVVMDVHSYEKIQDALILLKIIAQSEDAFKKGNWLTQEQMEREVRVRLGD